MQTHYVNGYVRIKLWGSGVERFFQLCVHKRMVLWQIEAKGKYTFANIRLQDFYQCKKLARKAAVRAVVIERHGLPFFWSKLLRRSFFLAGFFIFLATWLLTTNMVLHIRIDGNYSITEDVFRDFLDSQGVRIGMWKKDIPLEQVEKEIRKHFTEITWTSGKLDGTVLTFYVKENEKPVKADKTDAAQYGTSLYAAADGIVREILVRNGVPAVKIGAEVKKGDLLVDGKVPVYDQSQLVCGYQYYESDADILIETTIPVHLSLPKVYKQKAYTGRTKSGPCLYINGKIYKSPFAENNFDCSDSVLEEQKSVRLGELQIGYGRYQVREYGVWEREYTFDEAKKLLEEAFLKNIALLEEKGVQILENNVTIGVIMENWTLTGDSRVLMPAFSQAPNEKPEEMNDSEGL